MMKIADFNRKVIYQHLAITYSLKDVFGMGIELGHIVDVYQEDQPNPIQCVFWKIRDEKFAVFYPIQSLN